MWCDVISCCPVLLSTTKYYSVQQSTNPVLQSTTKYYSSTTKYYASTTPYYSSTRKYQSSTTKYYASTTKYYASTTLYYKVLLQYYKVPRQHKSVLLQYYKVPIQYYSVLQSTTPVLLQYYKVPLRTTKYQSSTTPVLQSTTPVLLRTTKYYSVLQGTTPVLLQYYKVPLRTTKYQSSTTPVLQSTTPVLLRTTKYYSVLQGTTPVLLCTTKYYSSTTPYYKVLRQYYSVLQSTTPVLQSTTPYYKVPIQYYKVLQPLLQSTTPVLQSTTPSSEPATKSDTWASPNIAPVKQNDSHAWSWSHMKRHLQCAEQQVSPSNLTKYCACHTEWLACLIVVTYETSFTMRGATGVTIQPHQILRLPHRMTRMLDRRHIWNVIYNARSNRCHHPTSPNTAPATQNDSHAWSSSHMKRHLQCAEQQVSPSNLTKYCACHEKWLDCFIVLTYETSFPMRGATGVTIQPHQIVRLPRKMTLQDFKENL